LYRGIIHFQRSYQPGNNIVKNKNGDLVADSHSILSLWRKYFSQLLTVHGANEVRHTEIHTADPLVPEPSAFESEMADEEIKRHKS
jgi:hypothetical protein